MRVIENLYTTINTEEKEMRYSYRLTSKSFNGGQAFGIEIERQDIKVGNVVKIVRDSIDTISNNEDKVRALLNLLFSHVVSPIHLVDIIGEYVDEYVTDFDSEESVAINM